MMTRLALLSLVFISSIRFAWLQTPFTATSGSLRQIIPSHYVYSALNGGRPFNSGVIAPSEGVLVVDRWVRRQLRARNGNRLPVLSNSPSAVSFPHRSTISSAKGTWLTAMPSRSGTRITAPVYSPRCRVAALPLKSSDVRGSYVADQPLAELGREPPAEAVIVAIVAEHRIARGSLQDQIAFER